LRLLLDTHALLWGFMSPERLPAAVRAAIRSPDDQIFVSVASLWEVAIKMRNGKLNAPDDLPDLIRADPDFELLPILQEHAWQVRQLPLLHRDPFDQLLVAQALVEHLTIVTHDHEIVAYAARTILI
jgi:PIN domain nuclease of toxin-antitoxin system